MKRATISVLGFLFACMTYGQDVPKASEPIQDKPAMTKEEAEKIYYSLGEKLNAAGQMVPENTPMFLVQMSVLADHSTTFNDEDKKLLDETGIAFFTYAEYYEEIIELLPVNFKDSSELIPIFTDEKRYARIKAVTEALTVLAISIAEKLNILINKIPSSPRLERWVMEGQARYEAAKNQPQAKKD